MCAAEAAPKRLFVFVIPPRQLQFALPLIQEILEHMTICPLRLCQVADFNVLFQLILATKGPLLDSFLAAAIHPVYFRVVFVNVWLETEQAVSIFVDDSFVRHADPLGYEREMSGLMALPVVCSSKCLGAKRAGKFLAADGGVRVVFVKAPLPSPAQTSAGRCRCEAGLSADK